ncbi:DUF1992 domain-containing protein [Glycomyces tenuis]|uniref:DnaJ family domain-containing protein n=1 Tax=Glycomyces tenuis TaxID=58116 RepID=UPI00041DFC8C|nr:DUF1992 domain-containing protein [Glycomyces tenuis]
MSDRQIRGVERAIREAEARGEFADLPGAGKPIPGLDRPAGEDWWLRQQAAREQIGDEALPLSIRLRKEVDGLAEALDALDGEAAVRDFLAELNARIRTALIGPPEGPPLNFGPIDVEQAVAAWRERRA